MFLPVSFPRYARRLVPAYNGVMATDRTRLLMRRTAVLWLALSPAATTALVAAESTLQQAPAVFLDTDPVAAKMLGAARDYLAARQWGDAVDLLRQIADQHGYRLMMIESARYVNVRTVFDVYLPFLTS